MGFVGKTSASASCGRPWGLSQYPPRKPSQILGGPESGRLFPLLASARWILKGSLAACIRPPPCFDLHTLQNPLGARHISKSLSDLVFRPVAPLVRSPLCQPATVKSLLAQARLSWNAKARAAVKGGTSVSTEKQLESGWLSAHAKIQSAVPPNALHKSLTRQRHSLAAFPDMFF